VGRGVGGHGYAVSPFPTVTTENVEVDPNVFCNR
jgi:hypothetical protein